EGQERDGARRAHGRAVLTGTAGVSPAFSAAARRFVLTSDRDGAGPGALLRLRAEARLGIFEIGRKSPLERARPICEQPLELLPRPMGEALLAPLDLQGKIGHLHQREIAAAHRKFGEDGQIVVLAERLAYFPEL